MQDTLGAMREVFDNASQWPICPQQTPGMAIAQIDGTAKVSVGLAAMSAPLVYP
jgi:hypothetical protein